MIVGAYAEQYYMPQETARQPVKSLDKNAFLQLLVAQLKNQNPMEPQDTSEFMSQLAQFSILEQITRLNEEIVQLRKTQELEEAAVLLGKQVKVQTEGGLVEGVVEKAAVVSGQVQVFINGTGYGLDQVIEVSRCDENDGEQGSE